MVREWGFSAKVGPISYGPEGPNRDNPFAGRPYAEDTQRSIDQEVARLLREAEDTATTLLRGHRDTLDQVIGTLNLFRIAPDGLSAADVVAATALVDVATIGILQERAVRQQEVVAGQLQRALNSRVIIEQAKGVLAERLRVTPDEAFVILRRYARGHNHPLTALAGDVIRGTARIPADG